MRAQVAAALTLLALTACDGAHQPAWVRLDLPAAGTITLRDVAACAGRWIVAGGRTDPDGTTHPAAWSSTDARAWRPIPFDPLPTSYYGPHDVISSIACPDDGDRLAMVGAWPGGAHGNPRVSTWRLTGSRMTENPATFETYGGDRAVDVGPMAAGPAGFAIAGNRTSGAATWLSPDGRAFTLFEGGAGPGTFARDVAALPDGTWAVVGGVAVRGSLDETAAVWLTRDGRSWTRSDPPAATGFNEIQRVVRQGDDLLAAGMRGTGFGLWRWHAGTWTIGETFGGDPGGVRSLTVAGGRPVLVGGGLWRDGRRVTTPAEPVAAAGRGDVLLLATAGGLWQTRADR